MTEPLIEYFAQRAVLVKLEAMPDTDPVLAPATDGFLFYDGSAGTEFDKVEKNPDRPFWGGNPFKVANKRAFIEGTFDLFPPATPGTSGALAKPLLLPAGFSETLTVATKLARYNPISSGIPAAWSRFYQGGEVLNVQSARHMLSAVNMSIGNGMSAKLRIQGVYDTMPEGVAPSVPTDDTQSTVATWDNSVAFLDYAAGSISDLELRCRSLEWDSGSDLQTLEFTGKRLSGHKGRTPTAKCVLLRPRDADINLHAVRDANGIINLRFRTYESDTKVGLYSEHGVRMQIDTITRQDIEGYYGYEISGPCIPSSTGGDELFIAFGDSTP
ncbi:MAG TPA: hypothetical protein VFN09_11455 [Rhodanobacteraceae bacterium]|nr:hypothetical protein [Rhodanobacteraceae bacterium]